MQKSDDLQDALAFSILSNNLLNSMTEKHNIPDTNSPVDNIIGEVDPDTFKCHDCHQWLPISELSKHTITPHCKKCHPDPDYSSMAMPLSRRVFPKMIANELVTVQPMPKPNGVSAFFKQAYKMKEPNGNIKIVHS